MLAMIFLGTGGGRFITIKQALHTGGLYIKGKKNIHIDPGPGALVRGIDYGIDFSETDILAVTHSHPDHYTDAEMIIEAMTNGGYRKRGIVIAPRSVIKGFDEFGPSISKYHAGLVDSVIVTEHGKLIDIGDVKIKPVRMFHSDPTTMGFIIDTEGVKIGYMADTEYHDELVENFYGIDVLLVPLTLAQDSNVRYHLKPSDATDLIAGIRPKKAILNHFGTKIFEYGVDRVACEIEKETGIKTVAAHDNMRFDY